MTTNQLVQALKGVGARFAVSTSKYVAANDPYDAKASYHIHPDALYTWDQDIVRVYSQKQLMDWVRTAKAVKHTTEEHAWKLWEAFDARWYDR